MQQNSRRCELVQQVAGALLVCSAFSCGRSSVEPAITPIVITEVSRASFREGDSVVVSVATTNGGRNSISIYKDDCVRLFEVLKGDEIVLPASGHCSYLTVPPPAIPVEIRAGETLTARYFLGGQSAPWAAALSPGHYVVRGRVLVTNRSTSGAPVQSPPIAIEIFDR